MANKYFPILKWKQGERIALSKLTAAQRVGVVPVIELPAIDAAPDLNSMRAALPVFLAKLAAELVKTFPEEQIFAIDTRYVSTGYPKQLSLLNVICRELQKQTKRDIVPVVSETMLSGLPDETPPLVGFSKILFRVRMNIVGPEQLPALVDVVRQRLANGVGIWLLIDQYFLVGVDAVSQAETVKKYLNEALSAESEEIILGGGSFPMNLVGYKQGIYDIPRVEWKIWKAITAGGAYVGLRYSDYAVTNPAPLPSLDPTQMNPSVAIRYAADGYWRLFKAGGFKNATTPNQYQALCGLLCFEPIYSGATFSYGDECYDLARSGKLGNGNPSSWRRDATSHHLVFTASML